MSINVNDSNTTFVVDCWGVGVFSAKEEGLEFLGHVDYKDFVKSLQTNEISTPILPKNCIHYKKDKDNMEHFTLVHEPALHKVNYKTYGDNGIVSFDITFPYIIFQIAVRTHNGKPSNYGASCFISKEKPTNNNIALYNFPVGNIGADGYICFGGVRLQNPTGGSGQFAEELFNIFLMGASNDDYTIQLPAASFNNIRRTWSSKQDALSSARVSNNHQFFGGLEIMTKENPFWWKDFNFRAYGVLGGIL